MSKLRMKISPNKICDPITYIDAVNSICPSGFVSYEECRDWAIEHNIKTSGEYKKFKKPDNIPAQPAATYKKDGWAGWKDFLGTNWVSYEECKKWARKKKIKSAKEYFTTKRPDNIPFRPERIYKGQGWTDWSVFLETDNVHKKYFVTYKECKKWAIKNKIKGAKEYCETKRPENIPSEPNVIYKGNGWTGWKDFLGTKVDFVNYEECKKWAIKKKIKGGREYRKTKRPENFPSNPDKFYKNSGWTNWSDLCDTHNVYKKDFVSYEECKKWAIKNKIKSSHEYRKTKKPENIPANAARTYKDNGWTNWYDFLGTKINFISYGECQKWAVKKKIKTQQEYHKSQRPDNIPYDPDRVYKNSGWTNWYDFLGTKVNFVSYEECKRWVKKNKIKGSKEYQKTEKPKNVPSNPNRAYKNNGWANWYDFLGTRDHRIKDFVSYRECKKWAIKNKTKSIKEYLKANKPDNMPSNPNIFYKNKGWQNWYDFLGKKS